MIFFLSRFVWFEENDGKYGPGKDALRDEENDP